MPSLHSAGVRIRLATVPLKPTLTPNIVLRKGEDAANKCERAEAQLRKGQLLDEERVAFPGDDEGFAMNWLGDVPFLMARTRDGIQPMASGRVYDVPATTIEQLGMSTRSRRSASVASTSGLENTSDAMDGRQSSHQGTRAHPWLPLTINPAHLHLPSVFNQKPNIDMSPKALVLHVNLSNKTFHDRVADGSPQHIKIDVFLNGQLSSCVLVHQNDIRAGAKSLDQMFAGNRVDYLAERPWVIFPPGKSDATTISVLDRTTSVQYRWHAISRALMKEANARGIKADGERPPTAQYLKDLASMQMPDIVAGMQKPGGRTFGVVDVIVSVGIGKKNTAGVGYARMPMRLVDEAYPFEVEEGTEQKAASPKDVNSREQERGSEARKDDESQQAVGMQVDGQDERIQNVQHGTAPAPSMLTSPSNAPPSFAGLPPVFHDPFTGASLPSLSPSGPYIYPGYRTTLSAPIATSRGSNAPLSRKRLYSEVAASTQNEQAHHLGGTYSRGVRHSVPPAHAPTPGPRDMQLPAEPSPAFDFHQYDGFMHSNPYQAPYANMITGLGLSGLPGLNSFDDSASSPLRDQASGYLVLPNVPSLSPQESNRAQGLELTSTPSESSQLSTPDAPSGQARRVTFEQENVAPYYPGTPSHQTAPSLSMPSQAMYNASGATYNSSPLAQYNVDPQMLPPHYLMNSFMCQPVGPPPPIGFFTATSKPKTKNVTPINPGLIDISLPRSSILVKRLRVTGIKGAPILDHQWKTPQRIASRNRSVVFGLNASPSKPRRESPGSLDYVEPSGRSRRKRDTTTTMATPPLTSPLQTGSAPHTAIDLDKSKRDSALSSPAPKAPAEDNTSAPASNTRSSRSSVSGVATMEVAKVATTPRIFSSSILGIQGPKANTFVFDDPEELLRRNGTKSGTHSRSISKTRAATSSAEQGDNVEKQVGSMKQAEVKKLAAANKTDSSPLSSLPASEIDGGNGEVVMLSLIDDSGPSVPPSSRQSPASPPPPFSRKPSISLANFATTKIPQRSSRQTRPPRGHDRVNTAENPPLNENCIIQLAQSGTGLEESEGKLGDGLLRQVKSERQGVFSEESVVVGVRFFVGA